MKLVDVHCHLDHSWFKDAKEVVKRAEEAGVKVIITSGFDKVTNRNALKLSKKLGVKASLGIYPKDVLKKEYDSIGSGFVDYDLSSELDFIRKNKNNILAIGEAGMDFSDENPEKEEQKKAFIKVISLAKELKKPLIVHSRKAEKEVLEILEQEKAEKVVLHCFSGGKSLIKEAAKKGHYFSIPANIGRAGNFQMLVKEVNINQLLTETDAPYMSPVKGEMSEPRDVAFTVEKIAEIKGFNKEEVANNIFMNYMRIFE